jgi:hypothetical protein
MSSARSESSRPNDSSVPRIPRAQWESHPNFPRQTLLLGSHVNFRRVSQHLIDGVSAEAVASLRSLYLRWMQAMRGHEGYEEYKLYPFLERRGGVSCGDAREGHEELHRSQVDVVARFDDSCRDANEANLVRLRIALRGYDQILRDHLELEEDLVIPLLLELSRAEFNVYYHS